MAKIGNVEFPEAWKQSRMGRSVGTFGGSIRLESGYDKVTSIGKNNPILKYSGFIQDQDALYYLDAIMGMFQNPDYNYPLYIDLYDNEIYGFIKTFRYRREQGYKVPTWRFDIEILYAGKTIDFNNQYSNEEFGKIENDWGI